MKTYAIVAILALLSESPNTVSASSSIRGNPSNNEMNNEKKTYILTFKDSNYSPSKRCEALAKAHGGSTGYVYNKVLIGCSMKLPEAAIGAMKKNPNIARIEADQEVFASELFSPAAVTAESTFTPDSWGLDRVNQCNLSLDNEATKQDATGVKVYIVDTGIKGDHDDFKDSPISTLISTSIPSCHIDLVNEGNALNDGNGHGTHVASTTCGINYGVASNCELCAVKVLSASGSGTTAGVIAGIDHVADDCATGARCVANMSLGGGCSSALNTAVANAVDSGVTFVVAAGNSNADACNYSPASEPKAITVGSTTRTDARSSFSNFGSCLDVYAPGSDIKAAWNDAVNDYNTISGTSMASPHVAGIAAGILGVGQEAVSPADVVAEIVGTAAEVVNDGEPSLSPGVGLATSVICNDPTISSTPTQAPTTLASCLDQPGKVVLKVDILTDNYASETTWSLTNTCTDNVIKSGGPYCLPGTVHTTNICVDQGAFSFTINDSYGDGICCRYGQGSYTITYAGNVVATGGAFGSSETKTFGDCNAALTTAPPTSSPVTPAPATLAPTAPPTEFNCATITSGGSCKGDDRCVWNKGNCVKAN